MPATPALAARSTIPPVAGTSPERAGPLVTVPVALLLVGGHLVFGLVGFLVPVAATAHAAGVALALAVHVVWSRRLDRLVMLTAYAALCDTYWRMSRSQAPWEFSKYLLLAGAVAILVRFCRGLHRPVAPLALLACLIPGLVGLVLSEGFVSSREVVSSVEMGMISLAVIALALRQVVVRESEAWDLLWVMLGPVAMVLAVTTWSTLTAEELEFTTESNFAVTAGFGPNQVSALLGLGILLCLLLAFQRRGPVFLVLLVSLGVWATWAALLTFSRGGVYSLVAAGLALLFVGVGTRGTRLRSVVTAVVAVVALSVTFSSVNDFSGSWLQNRYDTSNTSAAGRRDLVEVDLEVWGRNPLWGVGSGQSSEYHRLGGRTASAHTEYSRLLAEHGLSGLVAVALLVGMVVGGVRQAQGRWDRLFAAALGVWALTTMLHAATRIAAVGLVFALSQLRVEPDETAT